MAGSKLQRRATNIFSRCRPATTYTLTYAQEHAKYCQIMDVNQVEATHLNK